MTLIYAVPPVGAIFGGLTGKLACCDHWFIWMVSGLGLLTYTPVLRMFSLVGFRASDRLLYTLMTLDSALRHWRRGGA